MQIQNTTIEITPTSRPGIFEFRPPFKNDSFLDEFRRKVGKPYRTWNVFRESWQVRPLDEGHLKLMADLLEKHFSCPVAIADEPARDETPAALDSHNDKENPMPIDHSSNHQTMAGDARLLPSPDRSLFEMVSDRFNDQGLPAGSIFRVRRIDQSPLPEGIACSLLELAAVEIDGAYFVGYIFQESTGEKKLLSTRREINLTAVSSFRIVGVNIRVRALPEESDAA